MFKKRDYQLVFCCILSSLITLGLVLWKVENITGDVVGMLKFLRSIDIVKSNYDGDIDNKKLLEGAISGMIKSLDDPYSVYLDKKSFVNLNEMTEGSFGGIGIVFGKRDNDYIVISALPDNPGALAGIKNGDIILAVDDTDVKKLDMNQIAEKIRGKEGTSVKLLLKEKDGTEKTCSVVRKNIKTPSVGGHMLPDSKIGYIRITAFNEHTGDDFKDAYEKLEKEGMQAILLDLRGNPGGLLSDGVAVAKMLVPKGPIVSVVYNDGSKYTENSALEKIKYPLAVLVDNGTASAAEIVAGAIKDTKAGKLFGTKTFGKGSVQGIYKISSDTGIKLTTAKYYTPSGVSINKVGIEPDETVEIQESVMFDTQLEAAENYLNSKIME